MKDKIIEITKKTFFVPLHYMYWENEEEQNRFLESFAEEILNLIQPQSNTTDYNGKYKRTKT